MSYSPGKMAKASRLVEELQPLIPDFINLSVQFGRLAVFPLSIVVGLKK